MKTRYIEKKKNKNKKQLEKHYYLLSTKEILYVYFGFTVKFAKNAVRHSYPFAHQENLDPDPAIEQN